MDPHEGHRFRSEIARHLRGSIFPADRSAVLACAVEEHAPPALIDALRDLPEREYLTVEDVWEALGGERESLPTAEDARQEFDFRFAPAFRVAAAPFLVGPHNTRVVLDHQRGRLQVRFGSWLLETGLANVVGASVTGPYATIKTIGPPHLSLRDRGLTFATNRERGVCIRFVEPVRGLDPLGVVRHPAVTVTVADTSALVSSLRSLPGVGSDDADDSDDRSRWDDEREEHGS